jgi:hypothetical protein
VHRNRPVPYARSITGAGNDPQILLKTPDFFRAAQGLATPVSVSWGESRALSLSVRQVR